MPRDLADWTGQTLVELVSLLGPPLGDVGVPGPQADSATEQLAATGGPGGGSCVLCSFKAAASQTIARVGNPGAMLEGTNVAVNPAYDAVPGAGHLLVCVVSAGGAEPTTNALGWAKQVSANPFAGQWVAIWAKSGSVGGDIAPAFTAAGATEPMYAQLSEWSGVATVAAGDQAAFTNAQSVDTVTVANAAPDVAFGDLIIMGTRWVLGATSTASAVQSFNNGAVQSFQARIGNGLSRTRWTFASGAIVPKAVSGLPLGVRAWDYDVSGTSAPATGSQASVVFASVAGKAYRAAYLDASVDQSTAAAFLGSTQLLDGAASLRTKSMSCPAVAGNYINDQVSGLGLRGTAGNSMTFQFGGGSPGAAESLTIGAYLQ